MPNSKYARARRRAARAARHEEYQKLNQHKSAAGDSAATLTTLQRAADKAAEITEFVHVVDKAEARARSVWISQQKVLFLRGLQCFQQRDN